MQIPTFALIFLFLFFGIQDPLSPTASSVLDKLGSYAFKPHPRAQALASAGKASFT